MSDEKLADDLSAVTIPSCKHMEREEYRDCVLQMLDDLEQLGRRDGCIAAAWALDALPSLQRELAEAREEIERLKVASGEKRRRIYYQDIVYFACNALDRFYSTRTVCGTADEPTTELQDRLKQTLSMAHSHLDRERTVSLAQRGDVGVWVWGGDEFDHPESLTCPILISADQMRELLAKPAHAPSDVKGEEPSASDTNGGGKRIESDMKLTPLTAPSVRGVLVDDGEPTRDAIAGKLYQGGVGNVWQATVSCEMQYSHQPLKLRPASEFGVARHPSTEFDNHHNAAKCPYCTDNGKVVMVKADELEKLKAVAARGEPGLKKLPDGCEGFIVNDGPRRSARIGDFLLLDGVQLDRWCHEKESQCEFQPVKFVKLDPALYAIPDGAERTAHDRSSLRVSIERDTARERIKELEAELADWKADTADQLCVNCSDPLEYQERADAEAVKHWSGIVAKKNADAERLRKAIKDAISWLNCSTVSEKSRKILLAALDSPPNAEHQRQGSSQASDQTSTAGGCNEPPSPTAASGSFEAAAEIEANTPITSAPAAESDKPYGLVEQMDAGEGTVYGRRVTVKRREEPAAGTQGNAQHHIEGAKIPEGSSGSVAAESEGGDWEEQCNGLVAETEVERLEQCIEVYERSCTQWAEQCNGLIAERDALSARLATCEERCRELEAGIRAQLGPLDQDQQTEVIARSLRSLLAPKAGGEDGK